MVTIQWMSWGGKFRTVAQTTAATESDAMELIRSVYPEAKAVDDDPVDACDGYRVTATSPGGRKGQNIAFVRQLYDAMLDEE